MVRFVELSRPEAKAFLDRFQRQAPQQLDLTSSSLSPLWTWATPRLSWRSGYAPPTPGEPDGRLPLDVLELEDQLPSWFDPVVPGWARWSVDSLWLMDGPARYLGQRLVTQVPGAKWMAAHSRTKDYVNLDQATPREVRAGPGRPVPGLAHPSRSQLVSPSR